MHVIHNSHEAQVMPQVRVPRGWPPLWSCEERLPQLWCIIYMWMICFGGTLASVAKTVIYGHVYGPFSRGLIETRVWESCTKPPLFTHLQHALPTLVYTRNPGDKLSCSLTMVSTCTCCRCLFLSFFLSCKTHCGQLYTNTESNRAEPMFCCFVFCRRF